jgi:hypothetical protein
MHRGEEKVVASIAEMRDPALLLPQVAHRGREVHRPQALPAESDGGFRIEVEAAHPACPFYHAPQCGDGVDAEAAQRIPYAGMQRLQLGPPVGDPPSAHAQQRRLGAEDGQAEDQRFGIRTRRFHEGGDAAGRVLAIRIHGEHMREARFLRV